MADTVRSGREESVTRDDYHRWFIWDHSPYRREGSNLVADCTSLLQARLYPHVGHIDFHDLYTGEGPIPCGVTIRSLLTPGYPLLDSVPWPALLSPPGV